LIGGTQGQTGGTTVGATVEPTEPQHASVYNTVWYKWESVAENNGDHQYFRLDQISFAIDVYTGTTLSGLTLVASGQGSVNFVQHPGFYSIRVRPHFAQSAADFSIAWRKDAAVPNPVPIPHPYRNRNDVPIVYMVQADKYLIVQDGTMRPILYTANKAVRADTDNSDREKTQVPVGTIMAYGMGRLVAVVNDRDVAFGDIYGSHELDDPADSLIYFTERNFLAEGSDAAIPFNLGLPTGMAFFPQLDTSTGTGELLVFAERGASGFFMSLPRELWKTSRFQLMALLTTGLRGHRTISVVNEDLWFRSSDGIRTYRQSRSEPSGYAHIPLSTNVRQFLDLDNQDLLRHASSIYFDNRIMVTAMPAWNNARVFHEGAVVVDFDILSSFGQTQPPAWDGNWTLGPRKWINLPNKITQVVTGEFNGETRAFAFALDVEKVKGPRYDRDPSDYTMSYTNQLYELSLGDIEDWDEQDIEWELVTRAFGFRQQSSPFNENEIYDGDIWLKEVRE
jgi:hypothetical protein